MKSSKYVILLASIAIFGAMLACSALSTNTSTNTGPAVSNVRMTTDKTGKTPTSSYSPGDKFYVFADLSGLSSGSLVQAKWYVVNAEGVDPNTEINTSEYKYESGITYVYFELSNSEGGWPAGSYRVEVYLDGNKVGEQGFTVQ